MTVRKNISLSTTHLKKLEPLVVEHKGNLSAAIREIIDFSTDMLRDPDSIRKLINGLKPEQNLTGIALDWLLQQTRGRLIDQETLNNILDPAQITSMSKLNELLDNICSESYWQTKLSINGYDDNVYPTKATVKLNGNYEHKLEFLASILALFLARQKSLGISSVKRRYGSLEINFGLRNSVEEALNSVLEYFGELDDISREITRRKDFWKHIINLHKQTNYSMVTISKKFYTELLARKMPTHITTTIEAVHKVPIKEIPLKECIATMKNIYEPMGIVEKIDIEGDTLRIHHGYLNKTAIETFEKILLDLLKANGHTYTATHSSNLIVLKHIPEIGQRASEFLEGLKNENDLNEIIRSILKYINKIKSEKGIEEFSGNLGVRIGTQLLQRYAEIKNIQEWDMLKFIEACREIDTRFGRDARWELINDHIGRCKVFACPQALPGGIFDPNLCKIMQGFFEGAVLHAFKDSAKFMRTRTYEQGEGCCEKYLVLQERETPSESISPNFQSKSQ